jgi:fermentation-respiration switch protein FrsA (DUF1100 family)
MWAVLGFLVLLVAGAAGLAYGIQRSVLFQAPQPLTDDAALRVLQDAGGERIWLPTAAGDVEAWFLPPLAQRTTPAPLLLFSHGNAELIEDWVGQVEIPRSAGLGVLLVEFPGYGRSAGSPSQASITEAMTAAYDWAAARPGLEARAIVAHGRSLGGGAASALSQKRPLAALVLESSFTSLRELAKHFGLPGFLVRDPFDNDEAVRGFQGPVLILHGEYDELIPVEHARRLHEAAKGSEFHVLACGHNDCPRSWDLVREFLTAHGIH